LVGLPLRHIRVYRVYRGSPRHIAAYRIIISRHITYRGTIAAGWFANRSPRSPRVLGGSRGYRGTVAAFIAYRGFLAFSALSAALRGISRGISFNIGGSRHKYRLSAYRLIAALITVFATLAVSRYRGISRIGSRGSSRLSRIALHSRHRGISRLSRLSAALAARWLVGQSARVSRLSAAFIAAYRGSALSPLIAAFSALRGSAAYHVHRDIAAFIALRGSHFGILVRFVVAALRLLRHIAAPGRLCGARGSAAYRDIAALIAAFIAAYRGAQSRDRAHRVYRLSASGGSYVIGLHKIRDIAYRGFRVSASRIAAYRGISRHIAAYRDIAAYRVSRIAARDIAALAYRVSISRLIAAYWVGHVRDSSAAHRGISAYRGYRGISRIAAYRVSRLSALPRHIAAHIAYRGISRLSRLIAALEACGSPRLAAAYRGFLRVSRLSRLIAAHRGTHRGISTG
jgi:hypothetical protein